MHNYNAEKRAHIVDLLSKIYEGKVNIRYDKINCRKVSIEAPDIPAVLIDISSDLSEYETIARINDYMLEMFTDSGAMVLATQEDLEAWVNKEFATLKLYEEIVPGIWRVSGQKHNGHPEDLREREDFDSYIRIAEKTPLS